MTDIDPVPGVTQAVLQTMSGVNGNKILLTRLFLLPSHCFHLISDSRLTLLNGLRFKFTLMRRGGEEEEGENERLQGRTESIRHLDKRSRLSRLHICSQRTHWVIHKHIGLIIKKRAYNGPFD